MRMCSDLLGVITQVIHRQVRLHTSNTDLLVQALPSPKPFFPSIFPISLKSTTITYLLESRNWQPSYGETGFLVCWVVLLCAAVI